MRAIAITLVLTGVVAIATGSTEIGLNAQNTLTTIDQVPTRAQLDQAFSLDQKPPLQTLVTIATDTDPAMPGTPLNIDIGIRLRAIHALAKYCTTSPCAPTDAAHQSIASVIAATRMATSGSEVLILRAGIETIGLMKVAGDVSTLIPLLDHPSRDIRAATARALRDLCNPQAKTSLTHRYNNEMTDQVRLAISEALRILTGQCSN
jgi:hypothetical protein